VKRVGFLLTTALCVGTLLTACSHDGRSLKAASPSQTLSIVTTTTTATPTSAAPGQVTGGVANGAGPAGTLPSGQSPTGLAINGYWENGGELPIDSTCKGKGLSPDLNWSGVPADTTELVLTVVDADPAGFVNWVLAGIDPATPGLVQGKVPRGTVQALNSKPAIGWTPPCAPDGTHRYEFALYALTKPSGILPGMASTDAIAGLKASGSPHASITGSVAA
jgi:Raf kinase inhibitor-like YbhB/YbcL family protein